MGTGFLPNEEVSVQMLHHDGSSATGDHHGPWSIAADQGGEFTTGWPVCTDDCVGKVVRAVAIGQISGRHAEVLFTDMARPIEPPLQPPPPPGDNPGSGEITIDDSPSAAGLSADQTTYFPGTVATLRGIGFMPNEGVSVEVLHHDGSPTTGDHHRPWNLAADQDGAFITSWRVCMDDCVGKVVRVVAMGQFSGRHAEVLFTDVVRPYQPPVQPPPPGEGPGSGEITIDDSPSAAGLSADQATYFPGTVATLTGIGFLPNEAVSVQMLHGDGSPASGVDHRPWNIAADQVGAFTTSWRVCTDECVGKVVRAVATGQVSGRQAEALFTDAAPASAPPPQPPSPPGDRPGSGEVTIDDSPSAAVLTADQTTYFPGTVATLSGLGFQANEAISLQVFHLDGSPAQGVDHWPWRVAADEGGGFTTSWNVCTHDCVGKMVRVLAMGEISGRSAEVSFGDMPAGAEPGTQVALGARAMEFSLRQNSPNPFRESTTIRFALPEMSVVKIRVFSILGQEVATLANGTMGPGIHTVAWSGRDREGRALAAGMYFCRMEAMGMSSGAFHQLRRMTIIR